MYVCVCRRGAFNFSQAALPLLLKSAEAGHGLPHPPTLIFTGATAALKGNPQTAAFAVGKFALRALSQSLAKEFGPRGVHVSHAVIDGVIDIPGSERWHVSDKPDAKIHPEAVCVPLISHFLSNSPFPLPIPVFAHWRPHVA
jgi:NAD(P)-dependent dehydrogenase (short-subunit alcohol dehydrogenase family)